jgi:hypothetical protein
MLPRAFLRVAHETCPELSRLDDEAILECSALVACTQGIFENSIREFYCWIREDISNNRQPVLNPWTRMNHDWQCV